MTRPLGSVFYDKSSNCCPFLKATREEPIECTQSPYSLRVITVSCSVYCHTPAPLQQCRAFALSAYSSVDRLHWPRGSRASSKFSRMPAGKSAHFCPGRGADFLAGTWLIRKRLSQALSSVRL